MNGVHTDRMMGSAQFRLMRIFRAGATRRTPLILPISFLVIALHLGALTASAAEYSGKVIGVIDGDSIRVMRNGKAEQIRLNGVDCPERKQPFGTRAKQFTSEQAFGKVVTVKESGHDRYGRTLAEVILPDGRSLNQELLKAGLAWWFRKYSRDLSLGDLEDEARLAKRGLWADKEPVPPWEWRQTSRLH